MPELPEVETIVRALGVPLAKRRLVSANLRPAALYRTGSLPVQRLVGRAVTRVSRVGKNAVFYFEAFGVMVVNLGMTGRLILQPGQWPALSMRSVATGQSSPAKPSISRGSCVPPKRSMSSEISVPANRSVSSEISAPAMQEKHLHGRFLFDDGSELRYYDTRRFGFVYVSRSCDVTGDLRIGPDPFQADLRYLARALGGRRAPVKTLLLDQRIVSGLGNIYTDETLFVAGIDPRMPSGRAAKRAGVILSSARRVLERAIESGGSTIRDYRQPDGSTGDFQRFHAVYGREGEPCRCCGTAIKKIVLSGRGTHFCPSCQH